MLTKKQLRLLQCIHKVMETTGVAPTFDEMREQLNLRSKSGVHRMVLVLKEKGYINRLQNRARALEIQPRAYDVLRTVAGEEKKEAANRPRETIPVAMMGRIAAGTPIEALQHASTEVRVPTYLLGKGKHYALEVEGDSMTGIGIMHGDTVVIEHSENFSDGDVVVALIDGFEATLKRIFQRKGLIELRAENSEFKNRHLEPERVRVQGRVCALLRNY